MEELSNAHNVCVSKQDLEYMHRSHVNVSSFVSVKLSGSSNYPIWKAQMLCLMKSQGLDGIVIENWRSVKPSDSFCKQYDNLLKGWILGSLSEQVLERFINCEDARNLWKTLESSYNGQKKTLTECDDDTILSYVQGVHYDENEKFQQISDITLEGQWWKAKSLLKNNDAATQFTLLCLAVEHGKNYLIEKLLNFVQDLKYLDLHDSGGHTALHIAAMYNNIYAAKLIVKKRKGLLSMKDHRLQVPLAFAYIFKKLDTFLFLWEATENAKECFPPDFLADTQQTGFHFLLQAIYTKRYDLALKLAKIFSESGTRDDTILMAIAENFPTELRFCEALIYPSLKNVRRKIVERSSLLFHSCELSYKKGESILWAMRCYENAYYNRLLQETDWILLVLFSVVYPLYQLIHLLILVLLFPLSMLYFLLWKTSTILLVPIKHIEKKKKEYKEAKMILKILCDQVIKSYREKHHGIDWVSEFAGPILKAIHLDEDEVLYQILSSAPRRLDPANDNDHNIIQLAVINRSLKVYNLISPTLDLRASGRTEPNRKMLDIFGNNLLHLAGRLAPAHILSHTTGAALQLQRELQWIEELKKRMEPKQLSDINGDNETPAMVFTREHADLVKEGEKWMKATAESCSITAALIVTIVFAAAITVPGGNNQETGRPVFKEDIAFSIFAASDAVSLFTSATSLLVFLSILTTRFAEKDFLLSLPRRLFIALCLLFLSTTAMMLAFSAILFLVFCDQRPWMLAPIGALACLPIAAIVTVQLPLVVDLYKSTYSPIFGQRHKERSSELFY